MVEIIKCILKLNQTATDSNSGNTLVIKIMETPFSPVINDALEMFEKTTGDDYPKANPPNKYLFVNVPINSLNISLTSFKRT